MDRFRMLPNYQYHNDGTGILETQYKKELRDYQIYGNSIQDGTPSPDNPIEIQSVGEKTANLFNSDDVSLTDISDYIEGNSIVKKSNGSIDYYLKAGTYTLSFLSNTQVSVFFRKGQVSSGYMQQTIGTSLFITFTYTEDEYLRISCFNNNNCIFSDFMLVEGKYTEDTMPGFEPYGKYKIPIEVNDVTYNIFLDEPLRKCGDYADYIDFKNGKVVRNINKCYLADVGINTGTQYANGLCRFQQMLPNANYTVSPISNCMIGSTTISAYANHLSLVYEYKNLYAYFYASSVGLEPVTSNTNNTEIGSAIKNYVTEKNIYFYHVFKTPTETEIELPKIQLNKGTNIIKVKTTTEPSEVNWQYYK